MKLLITLTDIQHIKGIQFGFDLGDNGLICITGKNGAGKTTLVKAIRNIINADTFTKTSSDGIFDLSSSIIYEFDGRKITFEYDETIKSLNSKDQIPDDLRSSISVELPIPYGERFNFFQRISDADFDIRKSIILDQYTFPEELIGFLQDIYANKKFEKLVEISIKGAKYFCILLPNGRYLREDYLSSGEYFLISLYRRIIKGCSLIVIDEIDISLDAAAQVRLVKKLREFSKKYYVKFVFTTHSLAMMRTLDADELFYMDLDPTTGVSTITNVSYNYIKSILFGFTGWDKYILTEDDVLVEFLEYVILRFCTDVFYQYKIIFIGGGSNTTDLMKRNSTERFLADPENVITVLDGDQSNLRHSKGKKIYCIPIDSVEKILLADFLSGDFAGTIDIDAILDNTKGLAKYLKDAKSPEGHPHLAKKRSFMTDHFSLLDLVARIKAAFDRIPEVGGRHITKGRSSPLRPDGPVLAKDFNYAAKKLFRHLIENKIMSKQQIFDHLCTKHESEIARFSSTLREFLTLPLK
jgi:ABC-type dipeptide/oligopeptide/nickel transport system ATPase subunit